MSGISLSQHTDSALVIDGFRKRSSSFPEYELSARLDDVRPSNYDHTRADCIVWWAEQAAFKFQHHHARVLSHFNTHFGPSAILSEGDNSVCIPDIREIDAGILEYWKTRYTEETHPILVARYSDLFLDFGTKILNQKRDCNLARNTCIKYIESMRLKHGENSPPSCFSWGERALEISLQFKFDDLISQILDELINMHCNMCSPEYAGICDILPAILKRQPNVTLSKSQTDRVITKLRTVFEQCIDASNPRTLNPWGAESIAESIIQIDNNLSDEEKSTLITSAGRSLEVLAQAASPLLAMGWYDQLSDRYQTKGLSGEASRVYQLARNKGTDLHHDVKKIHTFSFTIDSKELEEICSAAIDTSSIEKTFRLFSNTFLPRVNDVKSSLELIYSSNTLFSAITINKIENGKTVAKIGGVNEDFEGRLYLHYSESLEFQSITLNYVTKKITSSFANFQDGLIENIKSSALYDITRSRIYEKAILAFMSGDTISFVHIILPQIEHMIRKILGIIGTTSARKSSKTKYGSASEEMSLNGILEKHAMVDESLGEDIRMYLLLSLADRRALNIRNRVAHGLVDENFFSDSVSGRLFHILLLLSNLSFENNRAILRL